MFLGNAAHRIDGGDLVDGLPEAIAARVRTFRDRADEATASMRLVQDRIDEQREAGLDIERQLALLQRGRDTRSPAHGGPQQYVEPPEVAALDAAARRMARLTWIAPNDPANVAELKTRRARSFAEMRRLEALAEPRRERQQARGRLVRSVEDFLRAGVPGGCILRPIETSLPKIKGNVADAIEDRRRRLREIAADISATEAAPIPAAVAKQRIAEHFRKLADRAPSVEGLIFGGQLEMPVKPMQAVPAIQCNPPILVAWSQLDAEALFAYALGDALERRLCADVDTAMAELKAAGTVPLSDVERARRIVDAQRDRLAVEREEVVLVDLAVGQGLTIEHREDASVVALLSCELITAAV